MSRTMSLISVSTILLLLACNNTPQTPTIPVKPTTPPPMSATVPTPTVDATKCDASGCIASISWLPYGPFEAHKGGAKYIVWTYITYHDNDNYPGLGNYFMVGAVYKADIPFDPAIPHSYVALNAYWKDQPDDPLNDLVHYSPIGQRVSLK